MPEFTGFSHIGLTISDLERSKEWYSEVLGWQMLMDGADEENGIAAFAFGVLPGGVGVALRMHAAAGEGDAFTPSRLGLDHASFSVASREVLEEWAAHLEEKGATYSPIVDAPYGAVLSFKDPDNIALEAFVLGGG
jgi:catechol 2,3-dioxygenase-like lactoylglutathione lyase family enzyme